MSAAANDATTAFLRAIRANFDNFELVVEEIRSRGWASATFIGARHQLSLRVSGEGAERAVEHFAQNLEAREFRLRGHILADITLAQREPTEDGVRLRLEALTVEDA